jgi:Undecaprenyl-phosphate galactose phosphotransferase WbaP
MEAAELVSDRSRGSLLERPARRRSVIATAQVGWLRRTAQPVRSVAPVWLADVVAAMVAVSLAIGLLVPTHRAATLEWGSLALAFAVGTILCHTAVGLYPGVGLSLVAEARRATCSAACLAGVFLLIGWGADRLSQSGVILVACCLLMLLLPAVRAVARGAVSRTSWWLQPAVILGSGEDAASLHAFLCRHRRLGLRPLGMLCDDEADWQSEEGVVDELLRRAVPAVPIARMWFVLTRGQRTAAELSETVRSLGGDASRIIVSDPAAAPSLWQRMDGRLEWFPPAGRWPAMIAESAKRTVDVLLIAVGTLLALPLLAIIALLIKWQTPGPVFYCQQRVGRGGRRFRVWKFRTMICDADRVLADYLARSPERRAEWESTHKLQVDPRITAIGYWLRKTSLDELPQLWNVLRGEMSLVGPRPIVDAEICKYDRRFAAYCSVLPGITGLWQVSGRSDTSYEERVELDSYYARNHSLWLDFYILLMTIKVVLFRQGAY